MNFPLYFGSKISFQRNKSLSKLAFRLAAASVALGIAIIIISTSVIFAFERAIQSKIIGFAGDIEISIYGEASGDTVSHILTDQYLNTKFKKENPEVISIEPFIKREGVLKSPETIEGVQMFGVDPDRWNKNFFKRFLKSGNLPNFKDNSNSITQTPEGSSPAFNYSKEILLSKKIASILNVKVDEKVKVYFLEGGVVRMRSLHIKGIYETGLTELDQTTVICDIRLLQRILDWQHNEVQGVNLRLKNGYTISDIENINKRLDKNLDPNQTSDTAHDRFLELFEWLHLQHQHLMFILIALTVIAILNMSTAVIIVISERTQTIGLLKAIGASNRMVNAIFHWNAFFILLFGIGIGNGLGLGLLFLQDQTNFIKLDPESYFVSAVPVAWVWDEFLLTNIGVIVVCLIALWLPTLFATGIRPVHALKFEN